MVLIHNVHTPFFSILVTSCISYVTNTIFYTSPATPKKVPFAPFHSTAGARKIKDLPTIGMQQVQCAYSQEYKRNKFMCESIVIENMDFLLVWMPFLNKLSKMLLIAICKSLHQKGNKRMITFVSNIDSQDIISATIDRRIQNPVLLNDLIY